MVYRGQIYLWPRYFFEKMVALLFYFGMLCSVWHFEDIPGASKDIVLNVQDDTCIAVVYHKDSVVYFAQRIQTPDSVFWHYEIVDTTPINSFMTKRNFTFSRQCRPHIIYHTWGQYPYWYDLMHACKDSLGIWQRSRVDSMVWGTDITVDQQNSPHIVYYGDDLWHGYQINGIWNKEYIDDGLYGGYISLVCDQYDRLYFGMGAPVCDQRQGYVVFGVRDTSGWFVEYLVQYDVRWALGLATSGSCIPYLCFNEFYGATWLTHKSNGSWYPEDVTSYNMYPQTLTLHGDTVHLLATEHDTVIHWRQITAGWEREPIYYPGFPRQLIAGTNGDLHCIIIQGTSVFYGWTSSQGCNENHANPSTYQKGSITALPYTVSLEGCHGIQSLEILDAAGRIVAAYHPSAGCKQHTWYGYDNHARPVCSGVYFVVVTHAYGITVNRIVVVH